MNKFIKGDTSAVDDDDDLHFQEMDVTEECYAIFAPGRRIVYSCINNKVLVHICEYTVLENHAILTVGGLCFTPRRIKLRQKTWYIGLISERACTCRWIECLVA